MSGSDMGLGVVRSVMPGRYQHIKGGMYDVLGVAVRRESSDDLFDLVGIATYTEIPELQFIVYALPGVSPVREMFYQNKNPIERAPVEKDASEPVVPSELGDLVIYWSLDQEGSRKKLWARTKKMFTENVFRKGGQEIPRFKYVGDAV